MGGNVAVTLRRNGVEHRMDRWTNPLPETWHDPDFLDGKDSAIEAYLKPWIDMAEDWKKNGPQGPFLHNMTSAYAPFPFGLQPSEYGAVVFDFDTHTLLSWQMYSKPGSMIWREYTGMANTDDAARTQRLFDQGRVLSARISLPCQVPEAFLQPLLDIPGAFLEQESCGKTLVVEGAANVSKLRDLAITSASGGAGRGFATLSIDMRPFQVEDFPEGPDGCAAMLARIEALGFVLDAKEREAWAERLAAYENDDA